MPALIEQHYRWPHFLRALNSVRKARPLMMVPQALATRVLAPATAIARFIQHHAPTLAEGDRIRLLILGAEFTDAMDYGRWYATVPWMLGRDFAMEVTLVGKELGDHPLETPASGLIRSWPQAEMFKGDMTEFFDSKKPSDFDLAFLFHPGFQEHHLEWFASNCIRRLITDGVVVGCTSYLPEEYDWDRYIIEAYGYGASDREHNPLHMGAGELPDDAPARWGSEIWHFLPQVPAAGHVIDQQRLEDVVLFDEVFSVGMRAGIYMHEREGEVLEAGSDEEKVTLIGTSAGCYVCQDTGDLYFTPDDGTPLAFVAEEVIPFEDLEEYSLLATPIERKLWAARMFKDRIYPFMASYETEGRHEVNI